MLLIRITPFTYHNIDTVNLRRIKRSGLYFGSSLSRFLPSETNKLATMANSLLSNKHLPKTNEPLLRMDKETMHVGRIKPCFLSFALGLSRFVRSGRRAYLTSMSMQGTLADGITIQAVADNLNLKIHITDSHPNCAEFTVVEAATPQQQLRTIYIGHLDEFHYMSTKHLVPFFLSIETWYYGSSC